MALGGFGAAAAAATRAPFLAVAAGTFLFLAFAGLSFPSIQVIALAPHGAEAGTAAALLGALNFGFASLAAPLVGAFGTESAIPMGMAMGIALTLATSCSGSSYGLATRAPSPTTTPISRSGDTEPSPEFLMALTSSATDQ